MSKTLISVAVVALAVGVSTPLFAEDASTLSVPVSYAEIDVSSPEGATALKSRIEHAASWACGGEPYILDLKSQVSYQACVKDAVTAAIASSGISSLATLVSTPPVRLAQK